MASGMRRTKKRRSLLWKNKCTDPATLGLRDCVNTCPIPPSVPSASSVSSGVNSEIFPEELNAACQENQNYKHDTDSSAGLGWAMLRYERGLNGRASNGAVAVTYPLMKFVRAILNWPGDEQWCSWVHS